jgi:hypothetical protein
MLNGSSCPLSYEAFLSDVLRQTEEANDDGTRDDNFREVGVILVFAEHNSILLHVFFFLHFFTSIQEDCTEYIEKGKNRKLTCLNFFHFSKNCCPYLLPCGVFFIWLHSTY